MRKGLENKLFKKYPKIFRQKDLPLQQTAMCWGIECGDGWYWLIDKLCHYIQCVLDENKNSNPENLQVEAVQVKEKFGGLRFYINGAPSKLSDSIFGAINFAEALSYSVCENCGSQDAKLTKKNGWYSTLCKKCEKKNRESK